MTRRAIKQVSERPPSTSISRASITQHMRQTLLGKIAFMGLYRCAYSAGLPGLLQVGAGCIGSPIFVCLKTKRQRLHNTPHFQETSTNSYVRIENGTLTARAQIPSYPVRRPLCLSFCSPVPKCKAKQTVCPAVDRTAGPNLR